jgi:FMN phosphatase YigB (HAD superfamily)
MMSTVTPADWRDIRLVAFDVDGTLYKQRPLRLRMGRDMVLDTVATVHDPLFDPFMMQ